MCRLEGLPPFQDNRQSISGQSGQSRQSTQWLIPSYRFTSHGNIARWEFFVTERLYNTGEFIDIEFSVWRFSNNLQSICSQSDRCCGRYCRIGRNQRRITSTQGSTRMAQFQPSRSQRISVRSGDIIGLSVSTNSRLDLQFSSSRTVNILINDLIQQQRRHPAPIINVVLGKLY